MSNTIRCMCELGKEPCPRKPADYYESAPQYLNLCLDCVMDRQMIISYQGSEKKCDHSPDREEILHGI